MENRRLKIAYLCDWTPLDRNLYSGGNARIYDALCEHVGEVTILPNSWGFAEPVRRLLHKMPDAINLRARWRLHLALGRIIAQGVRRELLRNRYDVLFTAYSFQSLARVKPPYPMVTAFTADATPTGYKRSEIGQSFDNYMSLSRLLDPLILEAERRIFSAQDLLLWPAEWQKQTADELFGLKNAQSVIVPWGANIDDPGAAAEVSLDPKQPLNLLFIGRDWFAKGGPMVLEMTEKLRNDGVDARLSIVGCTPPVVLPGDWVQVTPSLDKAKPGDLAQLNALYRKAHFLVMASFESWGFAFCEASAYGLPSLCLKTGGIPVKDGVNGHALAPGSTSEDFAAVLHRYLSNPTAYSALRQTTRREFEAHLNWDAWAHRVSELLHERLALKGL
ncbi:MAG: glycosyltransferase family 4 protein [Rhodobacteraceae bacterium]|nr:glycosyltransferase family 4 protein [Paracoccaceae bacterium]